MEITLQIWFSLEVQSHNCTVLRLEEKGLLNLKLGRQVMKKKRFLSKIQKVTTKHWEYQQYRKNYFDSHEFFRSHSLTWHASGITFRYAQLQFLFKDFLVFIIKKKETGRNKNRANYFHYFWEWNHCRSLQISEQNQWNYKGPKITQMVIFTRKMTVSNLLNMTLLPSDSSVYCGRRLWQARGEHRSRRCLSETCKLVHDTEHMQQDPPRQQQP